MGFEVRTGNHGGHHDIHAAPNLADRTELDAERDADGRTLTERYGSAKYHEVVAI
jgi:hypothetical protein